MLARIWASGMCQRSTSLMVINSVPMVHGQLSLIYVHTMISAEKQVMVVYFLLDINPQRRVEINL